MIKKIIIVLAIIIRSMIPAPAHADLGTASNEVSKMMQNMMDEIKKMRETIETQNHRIQVLESRKMDGVIIPQKSEPAKPAKMNEEDFKKMLAKEIENSKYFKNLKMGGDFRLRYEAFDEQKSAGALENRNRFRYRLRYGIENGIGNDLSVGFRLASATLNTRDAASGNNARTIYAGDPTSTNQTLGNPGLFSFNTIAIERAYVKYVPKLLKNLALGPINIKSFEIGGGKFENPHLKHSTPMIWDADVTPEGLYEKVDLNLYQNEKNEINLFGVAMQAPLKESAAGDADAELYSFQSGLNLVGTTPILKRPVEFTSAFAFYQYRNYAAPLNWTFDSGTTSLARGNTLCTGDNSGGINCLEIGENATPEIIDFYNELKLSPMDIPLTFFNDVAINVNSSAITGAAARGNAAWGLGAKVGGTKKRGDWELSWGYYQIPPNAVVGAFSDSDFGQGYANNTGNVFKAGYQLTNSMVVNFAWLNVRPFSPALTSDIDQRTNRFQSDLSWKF